MCSSRGELFHGNILECLTVTKTFSASCGYLKDKDGEFTEKDLQRYWAKAKEILTTNIPDASGFGLGFIFGLRS